MLLILMIFNLILAFACATRLYYVQKPPAPKMEVKAPKPFNSAVWIPGHWKWNQREQSFIWERGHWIRPRPGKVWIQGYWQKTPWGYVWVTGHWR